MINRTRKKYRNQSAGAEYSYSRSKRKCPGVWSEKIIDTGIFSNYVPKPHLKNCRCNATNTDIHFDTRFFNCNPQKGVTLKSPRHAKSNEQKSFISDVFQLYKARDPLHPKFDKTLLNRLFTKYKNLDIDPYVKQFVIDYIQDVMEMGRSFDPSVISPAAKVQSTGVEGEKYSAFLKQSTADDLMDSTYLDTIIKNIEKFKITLQGYKGYEFKRKNLEKSLKKTIKFFEDELSALNKTAEVKVTDETFKIAIFTIAARVEKLFSTKQADQYVKYARNRYSDRKADIITDSFSKKRVDERAKDFIKKQLEKADYDNRNNSSKSVRVRRSSNNSYRSRKKRNSNINSDESDLTKKFVGRIREVRELLEEEERGFGKYFYEKYKGNTNDRKTMERWMDSHGSKSDTKIVEYYLNHNIHKEFKREFEYSNDDGLSDKRKEIRRIFKSAFSDYHELNEALKEHLGTEVDGKSEQKDNYNNYLDFFESSDDTDFIKRVHRKFKDYKYNKEKLTKFLEEVYEKMN